MADPIVSHFEEIEAKLAEQQSAACCRDFANALELGTDSELYGAAISFFDDVEDCVDGWYISGETLLILFCPWCGKRLEPPK